MDERSQATGIMNFFLALLVGAIMTWIINTVSSPLLDHARDTTGEADHFGASSTSYIDSFLGNMPLVFLLTAFFALIVLSIFQREMRR